MYISVVFAALDGVHKGVGSLHPCSCIVGAKRELRDDAGLQAFNSGKDLSIFYSTTCYLKLTYKTKTCCLSSLK